MLEVVKKYQKVFERMEVEVRALRYALFDKRGGEWGLEHLIVKIGIVSDLLWTTFSGILWIFKDILWNNCLYFLYTILYCEPMFWRGSKLIRALVQEFKWGDGVVAWINVKNENENKQILGRYWED